MKIEGTDSYFTFLHTLSIQNFEKAKYKVNSLEELYVFLEEILKCIKDYDIRYCEIFISSYEPEFQQLLQEFGFQARGYAPCIEYNDCNGMYEDRLIFNCYNGEIEKIELLPQGQQLYDMLGL